MPAFPDDPLCLLSLTILYKSDLMMPTNLELHLAFQYEMDRHVCVYCHEIVKDLISFDKVLFSKREESVLHIISQSGAV